MNTTNSTTVESTIRRDGSNDKVVYTAQTHTTGGREGASKSSDGRLDIKLSTPGGLGSGTNPEQLFAAGWSACFIGALGVAAKMNSLKLPAETTVDAEVDLLAGEGGYALQARLNVHIPELDSRVAQSLIDQASLMCPYSKATAGNINTEYKLV